MKVFLQTFGCQMNKLDTALVWVIAGAASFLCLVIYVPLLQRLFHFEIMHPRDIVISLSAGILSVIWFEMVKMVSNKNRTELMQS